MNEDDALKALSSLAHPSRLKVVRELVRAGADGLTAGDLARALDASPSQTSFHLSSLAESGLVTTQRQSRHIIYRSNFATFQQLIAFLLEDCCGGACNIGALNEVTFR